MLYLRQEYLHQHLVTSLITNNSHDGRRKGFGVTKDSFGLVVVKGENSLGVSFMITSSLFLYPNDLSHF
jgi:hypothetical protein